MTLEYYKKEMAHIKPKITARDRKDCQALLGKAKSTISYYINGTDEAVSKDTYYDLLSFFRKRISDRVKKLNNL